MAAMHDFGRPFRVDRLALRPRRQARHAFHSLRHDYRSTQQWSGIFFFCFYSKQRFTWGLPCLLCDFQGCRFTLGCQRQDWTAYARWRRMAHCAPVEVLIWIREQVGCADAGVRNAWRYRRCRYQGGCPTVYHEPRKALQRCRASRPLSACAPRLESEKASQPGVLGGGRAWAVCGWTLIKIGGFDSACLLSAVGTV
jgi:hypothetical protein